MLNQKIIIISLLALIFIDGLLVLGVIKSGQDLNDLKSSLGCEINNDTCLIDVSVSKPIEDIDNNSDNSVDNTESELPEIVFPTNECSPGYAIQSTGSEVKCIWVFNHISDLPSAPPTNGDDLHISTAGQIYDWIIGKDYITNDNSVRKDELEDEGDLSFDWSDDEISDDLTLNSSSTINWSGLTDYPTGCSSGQAVQSIGDSLTCINVSTSSSSSLFTDSGDLTYLTSTTDDFAIGGSSSSSPFFFDTSSSSLSLGVGSPTAFLDIQAGTTERPPLRIRNGVAPSTLQSGDMYVRNDTLYFVPHLEERSVNMANGVITSSSTVANTTTETTIYTEEIGADELHTGKIVKCNLLGAYSTANGADTFIIRFKLGGVTLESKESVAQNVTNGPWEINYVFTIRTEGASGTLTDYVSSIFNDVHDDRDQCNKYNYI